MADGRVLGVLALAVVLVAVACVGLLRRRFDGRLRTAGPLGLGEFGIELPPGRATVIQFSGEFCATCPQTRSLVRRVLSEHPSIGYVDIDVAEHPEAVRAMDVRRTPTLVIVNGRGRPVHRASGMPREAELRQAVTDLAVRR